MLVQIYDTLCRSKSQVQERGSYHGLTYGDVEASLKMGMSFLPTNLLNHQSGTVLHLERS